jgi:hypothetical protein
VSLFTWLLVPAVLYVQVRNLVMRDTWQQEIMDALGGAQSQAAQLRSLPNICVLAACFDTVHTVVAGQPTLNPRFPKNVCRFENITLGNTISIKVGAGVLYDACRTTQPLGVQKHYVTTLMQQPAYVHGMQWIMLGGKSCNVLVLICVAGF